jgi:hypothetical protein
MININIPERHTNRNHDPEPLFTFQNSTMKKTCNIIEWWGRNINWYNDFEKPIDSIHQANHMHAIWPRYPTLGHIFQQICVHSSSKDVCIIANSITLRAPNGKLLLCLWTVERWICCGIFKHMRKVNMLWYI